MSTHEPLGVAVIGFGYWGPNLVRNVAQHPALELRGLCEREPQRGLAFGELYPHAPVWRDLDQMLEDDTVDAVIVATPPSTHHAIAKAALEAGKHVLVEKPLAKTAAEARDLIDTADRRSLVLMPGHTFVYSPPVNKVRELIRDDIVGEVYFVTSQRMNLGKYQADGVICDLAPHDISILLYWLDEPVLEVSASARSIFQKGVPETAFLTLTFVSGTQANVQVSWLAPRKMREMTVVGSQRMIQYDDNASDEPVRLYDRGIEFSPPATFGEYKLTYRSGDIVVPRLEPSEPLGVELGDFANAILTGETPRSSAQLGLHIVETLEAAETSLREHGAPVSVGRSKPFHRYRGSGMLLGQPVGAPAAPME